MSYTLSFKRIFTPILLAGLLFGATNVQSTLNDMLWGMLYKGIGTIKPVTKNSENFIDSIKTSHDTAKETYDALLEKNTNESKKLAKTLAERWNQYLKSIYPWNKSLYLQLPKEETEPKESWLNKLNNSINNSYIINRDLVYQPLYIAIKKTEPILSPLINIGAPGIIGGISGLIFNKLVLQKNGLDMTKKNAFLFSALSPYALYVLFKVLIPYGLIKPISIGLNWYRRLEFIGKDEKTPSNKSEHEKKYDNALEKAETMLKKNVPINITVVVKEEKEIV